MPVPILNTKVFHAVIFGAHLEFLNQAPYVLAYLAMEDCRSKPKSTVVTFGTTSSAGFATNKVKSMALLENSKPIQERFRELRDDWKSKTRHLSNTAQISLVFPYQMIIGMGPQVVPLILAELEKETDHWFWALEAITGENPVAEQEAGDVEASARAWIRWASKTVYWQNETF